jgi:hypothetical protein
MYGMIKFELSNELKQYLLKTVFDFKNSPFSHMNPEKIMDLKHLYNIFREKTIFSPYDYDDLICNYTGDGIEIGWNGQIDGEFYSAFIVYYFNDYTEDIDTIWLVDQDGTEKELAV